MVLPGLSPVDDSDLYPAAGAVATAVQLFLELVRLLLLAPRQPDPKSSYPAVDVVAAVVQLFPEPVLLLHPTSRQVDPKRPVRSDPRFGPSVPGHHKLPLRMKGEAPLTGFENR